MKCLQIVVYVPKQSEQLQRCIHRSTKQLLQHANLRLYFLRVGAPKIMRLGSTKPSSSSRREKPTKGSDGSDIGLAEIAGHAPQEPVARCVAASVAVTQH